MNEGRRIGGRSIKYKDMQSIIIATFKSFDAGSV